MNQKIQDACDVTSIPKGTRAKRALITCITFTAIVLFVSRIFDDNHASKSLYILPLGLMFLGMHLTRRVWKTGKIVSNENLVSKEKKIDLDRNAFIENSRNPLNGLIFILNIITTVGFIGLVCWLISLMSIPVAIIVGALIIALSLKK